MLGMVILKKTPPPPPTHFVSNHQSLLTIQPSSSSQGDQDDRYDRDDQYDQDDQCDQDDQDDQDYKMIKMQVHSAVERSKGRGVWKNYLLLSRFILIRPLFLH